MKISLIFTPISLRRNWSTLVAQDRHVGIIPPLSLAYVAAIAEKAGHRVQIIDSVAERLSLEDTIERINGYSPDILGFTLSTYGFHQTLIWIKAIKEKLGIPVMVGGWHLSLYPQETLYHPSIDYAIIGEAENILPNFLKALESGDTLYSVKGIAFRDKGRVILTPPVLITSDLDTVSFPARHLLKNELYFNILSRLKNFTVMLSARGCPYSCIFCDLNTKKLRMRSAKNFVDEIEINYKEFKIREFDIYDSSFTIDKQRVVKICEEIRKRRLEVFWTARSRVDTVDKYLLRTMALAGCNALMYGIETGDPGILSRLRKHTNLGNIKDIVGATKECGIKTLGFFMIGSPGETIQTALKTIKFSKSLNLDYVQVTKLTPFPNTEIYRMLLETGFGDYWREFTLDPRLEKELPSVGTELTPRQINRLVRKAYLSFYFRPTYILQALQRAKSALEIRNSLSAALGLIFD
jgi:anaerobic magnesium-protoporphyrin IX monomethyl ester cyclase